MMTKRAALLGLVIVVACMLWLRSEKRVGRNVDARDFILAAHAQSSNYGSSNPFATGGTTNNVIPKSNGSSLLADSALTDNGTTIISTEPIRLPAGSATAPALQMNSATVGFWTGGQNFSWSSASGNRELFFSPSALALTSNVLLEWSSSGTDSGGSGDTIIRRRSAANFALGAADVNGSPVAQTLSVQNAITGTNLAGAQFSLIASLGTGTALPAPFVIAGADASVASGGTAQTAINRFVSADTKNLTSGAATTLISIPLATLAMTGGVVEVYMEATDGTNQCTRSEEVYYSAENSAGVFVTAASAVGTGVSACTATKTLTATYALTSANPALLQVTPTLTGITATRFTAVYTVIHGGNTQPTL